MKKNIENIRLYFLKDISKKAKCEAYFTTGDIMFLFNVSRYYALKVCKSLLKENLIEKTVMRGGFNYEGEPIPPIKGYHINYKNLKKIKSIFKEQ